MDADVVVIGAGAAGLMAALCAARRGRRVVLLEKNERPGLKILISGGGRCNLTTTRTGRDLEAEYGIRRGRWLRHALRSFPPGELVAMVEAAGVPLREEDLDKIFPVSGRARDVLEAWLAMVQDAGARLLVGRPMLGVAPGSSGGFRVETPGGAVDCERLVLATGGLSYPKTGSTGDGYAACRSLGHRCTATVPALAPLAVSEPWISELAGIVLDGVDLRVFDSQGREVGRRRRPILFTHKGLSGPAPMDLAGDVEESGGGGTLGFDFAPGQSREALDAGLLQGARQAGRRRAANLLPRHLPERLRNVLVRLASADVAVAELSRPARRRLVEQLKATRVPVDRSLGFAHAEVTRGGVPLEEVDGRTMESKIVPGLFLCGELLDVDGPIGGFNFQAAFATGRLAGRTA